MQLQGLHISPGAAHISAAPGAAHISCSCMDYDEYFESDYLLKLYESSYLILFEIVFKFEKNGFGKI